jgi:hypothetical protein
MGEHVPVDLYEEFEEAVRDYWRVLAGQRRKQEERGVVDQGRRSESTGGKQMDSLANLIAQLFKDEGLPEESIRYKSQRNVPGYYRPTKDWDLLVVHKGMLVAAVELKSIASSFGKNMNNRIEEAIGIAEDVRTAYREGTFGTSKPWLGYLFVISDEEETRRPTQLNKTSLPVDEVFLNEDARGWRDRGVSYQKRAETFCRRLVLEQLYDAACFVVSSRDPEAEVLQPADDMTFGRFAASIRGHARYVLELDEGV